MSRTALGAQEVVAGDVDGDGDLDLVVSAFYSDPLTWYENLDGRGNFGTERTIAQVNSLPRRSAYQSIELADVDSDGDVDVISRLGGLVIRGDIRVFRNLDGSGTFDEGTVISTAHGSGVDVADLDADGDVDILYGSATGTVTTLVYWNANDGNGNFSERNVIVFNGRNRPSSP